MKKSLLSSSSFIFSFASFFVFAAGILARSGSFFMWGEPQCPKDLIK